MVQTLPVKPFKAKEVKARAGIDEQVHGQTKEVLKFQKKGNNENENHNLPGNYVSSCNI